ncbi:MAG: pyridoxamine 5'-phosphate oxidase family protein [Treponema sp.]|nr:pyridoxamine 5'-phosphate oxidase family protein [Treponema sp.]
MDNYFEEAINVMKEIYGKDVPMSLATVNENKPNIRVVDTYFKDNAFYVVTYALSNKIKEIKKNSNVALNKDLFVAHGIGKNIGHPLDKQNLELRDDLRKVFMVWYDKHNNEDDKNMCFLEIKLTDGLVFANDYKYYIDFENKEASREKFIVGIVF